MSEMVLTIANLVAKLPEHSQVLLLSLLQRMAGYDEDDILTWDDVESHRQALEDVKNGVCVSRDEVVKRCGLDPTVETQEQPEVELRKSA